jgi:Protein of unknown function (DUF2752)
VTSASVRDTGAARWSPARFAALVTLATAADVALDPQHTHVPLCPFHSLTGMQCPLCGSLRAVDNLVRGHPFTALHDNLLLVAALPVLAVAWLDWVAQRRAGRPARRWPNKTATVCLVVLLVGYGVVRNLPSMAALRPS